MKRRSVRVLLSLVAIPLLACLSALAQVAVTGSVTGTVGDATGALIPGATVRLTNQETGMAREQETDAQGTFVFDRVRPGLYTVTIFMQGFRTAEVTDLVVRVGKSLSVGRLTLEVGAAVQTVTITETAAPLMETESAQITGNYASETVTETMLGTFGIDVLAFLTPGVQPGFGNINTNAGFGSTSFNGATNAGNSISANGLRSRFTGFSIDGQDNNDVTIGGPGYFVDMFDTVEEYQISTNQFNADQGRNLGASVNIITRSGTNEHHGSVFWFHENAEKLNAVSSDEARQGVGEPAKFIENFFGFTWGGPLITDKLFGFAAYQRIKDDFSQFDDPGPDVLDPAVSLGADTLLATLGTNTASILASQGMNIPFGSPTCQVGRLADAESFLLGEGATSLDPTKTFAFFDLQTVNSAGLLANSVNNVPFCSVLRTPSGNFLQDEFMMKVDWVGEKNTAGGKYMWQDSTSGPFDLLFNGLAVNVPARSQFVNMYHTIQLSPRMLNEFRFSYQRLAVVFEGNPDSSFARTPGSFPISDATTNLGFFVIDPPFNFLGLPNNIPQDRFVNTFQFADNWSLVYGRHTIKAGAEIRRIRNSFFFLPSLNGLWVTLFGLGPALTSGGFTTNGDNCNNFSGSPPNPGTGCGAAGLEEFLSNQIGFLQTAAGPRTTQPFETHQFYYVQDDFRIRPNFTLNLGIRFEHFGQPVDDISKEVISRESDPARALFLQSLPLEFRTNPVIGSDDNNWAPRIGFAYTPRFWKSVFGEDKTVIRGGYGIAYDVGFQNILANVSTAAPRVLLQSRLFPGIPVPGNGSGDALQSDPATAPVRNFFDPRLFTQTKVSGQLPGTKDLVNPYAQQWSLGIQREIKGTVVEARYVGTKGIGLFQSINANPLFATQLAQSPGTVPAGLTPDPATGRLFGDFRTLRLRCNCARSEYHGLQTRWDFRNLFNQLTGGVSYTWSKNIDNVSEIFNFSSFNAGSRAFAQNPFDIIDGERGLSNFDQRNNFSFNFVWHLPFARDQVGGLGKLAGGWEFTGTGFIFSGRPFTAFQSSGGNSICLENSSFSNSFNGATTTCRPFVFNPDAPVTSVGSISASGACSNRSGTPVPCSSLHFILNNDAAASIFGTPFGAGRNINAGDGTVLFNLGIFKNTYAQIGERRVNLQFRSQFVNLFNHRNHGIPSVNASSSVFGNEGENNVAGRIIRFGIRLVF
ncbi:MAG: carboxypeptidase regulatory-like domain-containing protein [Terriglobia bacterium]